MNTLTAYLTTGTAAAAAAGFVWRGLRGLHRFVDAVTTNTGAVTNLARELHDHTTTTTAALSRLDQRVTTLEGTTP